MKLSFLVTCHNETDTLKRLLEQLGSFIMNTDDTELVVVVDKDAKDNEGTKNLLGDLITKMGHHPIITKRVKIYEHSLDANYGAHKNWGTDKCTGDYIFQIDGDERPTATLLENIIDIIDSNPSVELIFVPRINDFRGVTSESAQPWGWRLTPSPTCEGRPIVNWPDYQSRIYKRVEGRIRWDRKLHEKIEGHDQYSFLPAEEELALYHDKTIEIQLKTNERYNRVFTEADNRGHTVA